MTIHADSPIRGVCRLSVEGNSERRPARRRTACGGEGPFSAFLRRVRVKRIALTRRPASGEDDRFHSLRRHLLSVTGAGGAGNALVHAPAPEIVNPGAEAMADTLAAELHP